IPENLVLEIGKMDQSDIKRFAKRIAESYAKIASKSITETDVMHFQDDMRSYRWQVGPEMQAFIDAQIKTVKEAAAKQWEAEKKAREEAKRVEQEKIAQQKAVADKAREVVAAATK